MFADALRQAGSDETEPLLSALSGSVYKGPGGDVFLDTETNHATLRPLIGRASREGKFNIVWRGSNVIRPDPYLVGYDRTVLGRVAE
jgi:branched-chain amino acid transport system substrate-binding protein